ncbi:MAG: type II secretion system protein GspG [Gemmatimonadota bacterium]|nr:type II secretion system protein GspG [Gemmatimonadota bacterium]MDE3004592.1 type II secretion system protein GspG [Gemmatimonadota bacterium]
MKKLIMWLFVALAVAMAVPSTRVAIEARAIQPVMDNIGERIVPGRLEAMANQLDARLRRAEGLPAGFEGWLRRDYTSSELDPWDNVYFLETGRRSYTVGSMGPDGVQGTEDDITVERPLQGGSR